MEQQLAELQQQQAATAQIIKQLQQENVELKNALTGGLSSLSSLPAMAASMQVMMEEMQKGRGTHGARESLFDTKGLGKPKVFEEKEAKFSTWSRKFENFIVGHFGEPMRAVLQWAQESDAPIDKGDWDLSFGSGTGDDEVEDLDYKISQIHIVLVDLTEEESNDLVVGAGDGNGLEAWRKLSRRWDPASGGRKRALLKAIINPPRCKLDELQGCLERWLQQVQKYERRKNAEGIREKVSDDVKCAALDQLIPADLENHVILNRHRLKTFEQTLAEITSIVEAKTGSKIKQPSIKASEQDDRGNDPMDVGQFGKGAYGKSQRPAGKTNLQCHRCGKMGHVQKDCWSKDPKAAGGGKASATNKDIVCHQCGKKGHIKKDCWHNKDKDKGKDKGGKGGGRGKDGKGKYGKGGKKGRSTNSLEEEEVQDEQSLDLSMMTSEESEKSLAPFERRDDNWLKMNLDSGSAITGFPRSFKPPGHQGGNGKSYRAATGELVEDEGGVKVRAEDEYGQVRGMKGRIADIHKPLLAAGECTDLGQKIWLSDDGGWIVPGGSDVSQKIQRLLEAEAKKGQHKMLPVYKENGVFNVYLKMGARSSIATIEEETPKKKTEAEELRGMVKTLAAKVESMSGGSRRPGPA